MTIYDQLDIEPFNPTNTMKHPLAQTVIPYFWPQQKVTYPLKRELIPLEDGDQLAAALSCPVGWQEGQRIVVLYHGLAGCEDSPYLVRVGKKLFEQGYFIIRVNLRACGPGLGFATKPYHSGRSEDARAVLKWIEKRFPKSPITQLGFSLSANITLKMLGEDDQLISPNLDSAMAISPPLDLRKTAHKLTTTHLRLFDFFFLQKLKQHAKEVEKSFPNMEKTKWPRKMNLIDFDDLYTAPRSGFKDANDYYTKSSCLPFIKNIKRNSLILLAKDDPVICTEDAPLIQEPSSVEYILTERGGHVGFVDNNQQWMDDLIVRWIKNL